MKVLRKFGSLVSATVLALSSFLVLSVPQAVQAAGAPYTCTWTGSAGDGNFSTAGNWSGCNSAAPVATDNDNLIFDNTSLSANANLNNDISNLQVGSISFSGTNSNYYGYTITGNGITLNGDVTQSSNKQEELNLSLTLGAAVAFNISKSSLVIGDSSGPSTTLSLGGNTLTISDSQSCSGASIFSALSGSGSIDDNVSASVALDTDSPSFSGTIAVNSGEVFANSSQALGSSSANIDIASGANLALGFTQDSTFAQNFTLNGTGPNNSGVIKASDPFIYGGACAGGNSPDTTAHTATISGTVTLQSNATIATDAYHNVKVAGPLSGAYTLSQVSGSGGTLSIASTANTSKTPNGTQVASATTVNYNSNSPTTPLTITSNETAVVDGSYGNTEVQAGGILKGTGDVAGLNVDANGTVSPGHSPGCLTVNGDLNEAGTYVAELGGATPCSGYDQLKVTGTVYMSSSVPNTSILNVSLVNGYKPAAGTTFEIINNEGKNPVSGDFQNLPEGSTFKVGNAVFKISYKGGTGNDVVLTVVSDPGAPDTGMTLVSNHAELSMIGGLAVAGGLLLISRRVKSAGKRR